MKNIHNGFKLARHMTQHHAKTFYFASLGLANAERQASYSIYAICRLTDDSVDQSPEPQKNLEAIRQKINLAYKPQMDDLQQSDDIISAFRLTVNEYHIPNKYFNELLSGMEMDLTVTRYENFAQLYSYCYKVAGVVGLIMLKIFKYENPRAEQYAEELGIAMQLTNILRDINEDYGRGRIYVPAEDLNRFKITETDIKNKIISDRFIAMMKFEINRAREYYQKARAGIPLIKNKRGRIVTHVMADLYEAILDKIEQNRYDVFTKRARLSLWEKFWKLLKNM
ncbi:MAG: phytoene/squalene synthase family protein [Candidatus Omnitrophica bacterium]|nr:phytoene/squalene synthase family protein [Candidatus Omnitrophota bacterium]